MASCRAASLRVSWCVIGLCSAVLSFRADSVKKGVCRSNASRGVLRRFLPCVVLYTKKHLIKLCGARGASDGVLWFRVRFCLHDCKVTVPGSFRASPAFGVACRVDLFRASPGCTVCRSSGLFFRGAVCLASVRVDRVRRVRRFLGDHHPGRGLTRLKVGFHRKIWSEKFLAVPVKKDHRV